MSAATPLAALPPPTPAQRSLLLCAYHQWLARRFEP